MAVLHTEKIHICALKKNRKQILEELQRTGRIQIEADTDEDEIFRHMDTASASSAFEKRAANAEEALKILETCCPLWRAKKPFPLKNMRRVWRSESRR